MLKIKDEVKLSELERFGFKMYGDIYLKHENRDVNIYIVNKTRVVEISVEMTGIVPSIAYNFPTTIYDLIKADMVEKI